MGARTRVILRTLPSLLCWTDAFQTSSAGYPRLAGTSWVALLISARTSDIAMFLDRSPAGLDPLPSPYHVHFAATLDALEGDERVRAARLSRSLARETADAASDLALILAAADDAFDTFVDGWSRWLAAVVPVLVANDIPGSRLIYMR
jgi:hypothetical protein